MEDEPTIKYSVLLPKSLHRAIKQASLDRDVSMQKLLRLAIVVVLAEINSGREPSDYKVPAAVPAEHGLKPADRKALAEFIRLLKYGPDKSKEHVMEAVRVRLQLDAASIEEREKSEATPKTKEKRTGT